MVLDKKTLTRIDAGVRELVIAMNEIDGIETITICEGHEDGHSQHLSWVAFQAKDLESLHKFQEKIVYNTKTHQGYYTKFYDRTGECYSGYWIEADCDYSEGVSRLLFLLIICSQYKEVKQNYVREIIERLRA